MDSASSDQHPGNWWRVKQVYSEMRGVLTLLISDPDEITADTQKVK